jgi:hypothetical protein
MSLLALRRYTQEAPRARRMREACELCGASLAEPHRHVVDLDQRNVCCACQPCALAFTGAGTLRYRTVPDRVLTDPASNLTETEWTALEVPVRLAFFFFNSRLGRWVAFYPSPAGPTESQLSLAAFDALVARNPLAAAVEKDVEALLVYGGRSGPFDCFLVPIVRCYELVGEVRRLWRGFDGGDEVRHAIESFFANLRAHSRRLSAPSRGGAM